MSAGDATIHRVPHKRSYTMISNKVIKDKALSFKALGVLVYLLSKPDNWKTRVTELAASHTKGAFAVKKAMEELEEAGYLVRRVEAHGRFEWDVHEKPQIRENPDSESADQIRENPDSEGAETADLTYAETARVVSTEVLVSTDLPSTENPSALSARKEPKPTELDPIKKAAHTLATRAFELDPKPVLRENGKSAFPAVMAIFERLLRAGTSVNAIRDALDGGFVTVWTVNGIQTALSQAKTRRGRHVDPVGDHGRLQFDDQGRLVQ